MSKQFFGTDGIRGAVGQYPITADFMLKLGWAAGKVFAETDSETHVLIGKDTREYHRCQRIVCSSIETPG